MCSQINHDDDGGGGLLSGGLLSVPVSRIYSTPTTKPAVATSVSKHLRHQNVCKSNTSDSQFYTIYVKFQRIISTKMATHKFKQEVVHPRRLRVRIN